MTTELLRQALDALVRETYGESNGSYDVIDAIRQHLAQPPATSGDYALGYAEGFNDACKPRPQAEPEPWAPSWPQFVEYWTHESHLQTFADRERFRSAANAMLAHPAAPVPVPVPPGWMPIETAPKDGSEIIMSNGKDVSAGSWFNGSNGTCDCDGAPNDDERDAQWMDWSGGMQPDPTHWMPLPPAPGTASPPPVALTPLTDEQIFAIASNWDCGMREENQEWSFVRPRELLTFARDIEAAHDIAPGAKPDNDCTPNHFCSKVWVHLPQGEQCERCGHE